jgi:release factor glutamine methyltransferase
MRVSDVLNGATETFKEGRIDNPRLNAELLLALSLNLSREGLYVHLHDPIGEKERKAMEALIRRRLSGEPLQYILGHQEFWSIDIKVDPRVLIPRADTELLVEQTLFVLSKMDAERAPTVLEIGTGSGAIAIALAREARNIFLVATDISGEAVRVAGLNAKEAGVSGRITFINGDLFGPIRRLEGKEPFDIILSNPPYIVRSEMGNLAREVKDFEPTLALDGGKDGLEFHRKIIVHGPEYLRRGGWLLLEVGQGQAGEVAGILETTGNFRLIERVRDLVGIERVVRAQKV